VSISYRGSESISKEKIDKADCFLITRNSQGTAVERDTFYVLRL
jgi:hypothetical protein